MDSTEPRGPKIGQIALTVNNMDAAVEFYRDVIGLPFLFEMQSMVFFDCSGVRIMLSLPENDVKPSTATIVYFDVVDIHVAFEQMKGHNVNFLQEPHMIADLGVYQLWMAFFNDLDGNTLALMSEMHV